MRHLAQRYLLDSVAHQIPKLSYGSYPAGIRSDMGSGGRGLQSDLCLGGASSWVASLPDSWWLLVLNSQSFPVFLCLHPCGP